MMMLFRLFTRLSMWWIGLCMCLKEKSLSRVWSRALISRMAASYTPWIWAYSLRSSSMAMLAFISMGR